MGMVYLQERGAGTVTGIVLLDGRAGTDALILDSTQFSDHLLGAITV
jgi:hypothetical protein